MKKIVSWLGTILMIVSLGFIARRLMEYGIDFSLLTSPIIVAGLLAVAFAEGIAMFGAAFNFRALLKNASGVLVEKPLAAVVYLTSNLYKYIPGSVLYVAGRHRIAVETKGLTHAKLAFSTIVEGVFYVVGALIVAIIFAFDYSHNYIRQLEILPLVMLVIGIVVVIAAPPIYLLRHRIEKFLSTIEIFKFSVVVKRFGFALGLMFLWGITFLFTLMLLGQPMSATLAPAVIGLYLLAWLAGFLTPGAPSGLGVREAVMLMFLGGLVYTEILLAAMVIHRVITVAGDIFGYLIAIVYEKAAKERALS
ncbi:MAG: lysylphosphatidylglycerol synthase domain-containing protein [Defluviitaleaceae bacterium]|nr:lysylphosphatidylglycerol synthase domain-containing protein [Defluviitaleaceae bacterium]